MGLTVALSCAQLQTLSIELAQFDLIDDMRGENIYTTAQ